jgi:hypothetical protein
MASSRDRLNAGSAAERELLCSTLVRLGEEADHNSEQHLALTYYECAFAAVENFHALIRAADTRRALGQHTLTERLCDEVLRFPAARLPRPLREQAARVRQAARDDAAQHAAECGSSWPAPEDDDEIAQLLRSRGGEIGRALRSPERADDAASLLRLMRKHGHHANDAAGDCEAARRWFETAFSVSAAPSDLLSAANMRLKASPTSAAATRLYDHVLTLGSAAATGGASESERRLASEKLGQARESRQRLLDAAEAMELERLEAERLIGLAADQDGIEWIGLRIGPVAPAAASLELQLGRREEQHEQLQDEEPLPLPAPESPARGDAKVQIVRGFEVCEAD